MIKDLVKIANRLQFLGLKKEADIIQAEILKLATGEPEESREEEGAGENIVELETPESPPVSEMTPEVPTRPKEGEDLANLIKYLSSLEPYERWVYLAKANPNIFTFLNKIKYNAEDIRDKDVANAYSYLFNEEKKELNDLKKAFRIDVDSNRTAYQSRWEREQKGQEMAARSGEDISFAAFQLLEPHVKGRVFLAASEKNKREIIDRMSNIEAASFLELTILPNLKDFRNKLKEGDFKINLKIKFMKKLAKSTEDVEASKARVKAFYNLLSDEDKIQLREVSRGGGAIVSGNPFEYHYGIPQESYEVETIREAPSIPHVPENKKKYPRNQPPILPEEVKPERFRRKRYSDSEDTIFSDQSIKAMITNFGVMNISTVRDIEPTDYCVFQLLPNKFTRGGSSWIFRALLRTNLDHPEFQEDPVKILNLHKEEAERFGDVLEKGFKEESKRDILFNIKLNPEKMLKKYKNELREFIGDMKDEEKIIEKLVEEKEKVAEILAPKPEFIEKEGEPGDCIVLNGEEAADLISSGRARFTAERWSGSDVYLPQFGNVPKPSSSDKYTSEALVESDMARKVNPNAPTVFTPSTGGAKTETVFAPSTGGPKIVGEIPAVIEVGTEVPRKERMEKLRERKRKREMISGERFDPIKL